jgi:hypothetical protein
MHETPYQTITSVACGFGFLYKPGASLISVSSASLALLRGWLMTDAALLQRARWGQLLP